LTGIDTDRLKEEKERGITIELGFASLTLPSGLSIGIVDVPGHERFIRNMVAGAAGIDLVVLVIASDEGVMPQTREHLAICSLLGVSRGLIALTKIDMVDPDWLALVTDDIATFLQGTFLEGAPIVPVSAVSGDGLTDFLAVLDTTAALVQEKSDTGLFRLPVDRVFTIKGFGTVVTGTLLSGQVHMGDEVEILPGGTKAKVRGLQVHNRPVETAGAGQRTAVNLQGVDRTALVRGDILTRPGAIQPTRRLDVRLTSLETNGKTIKNRQLVRFHTGTNEIVARVTPLEGEGIEPGTAAFASLFLEKSTVVLARDHFVIRSYSPVTTIGGGVILDPWPGNTRGATRSTWRTSRSCSKAHRGTDARASAPDRRQRHPFERAGDAGRHGPKRRTQGPGGSPCPVARRSWWTERNSVTCPSPLRQTPHPDPRVSRTTQPQSLREGVQKEELRNSVGFFYLPKLFNAPSGT
jgi:selenocysteine-specific elongation factor